MANYSIYGTLDWNILILIEFRGLSMIGTRWAFVLIETGRVVLV
jgi:hypothetical protein